MKIKFFLGLLNTIIVLSSLINTFDSTQAAYIKSASQVLAALHLECYFISCNMILQLEMSRDEEWRNKNENCAILNGKRFLILLYTNSTQMTYYRIL